MRQVRNNSIRQNWDNAHICYDRDEAVQFAKDLIQKSGGSKNVIVTGYQGSWQVEVKQ